VPAADLAGLAGVGLAVLVIAQRAAAALASSPRRWLLAALAVALCVPLAGVPLAGYVRGVTGDLSITTIALLALTLAGVRLAPHTRTALYALVAAAAIVLYPMALGLGLYDPYRLGYGSAGFVAAVAIVAALTWLVRAEVIALVLALGTIAWAIGAFESTNLWDYLIDPFVTIYAVGALAGSRRGRRVSRAD
jgi:hypothetical protein